VNIAGEQRAAAETLISEFCVKWPSDTVAAYIIQITEI